MGHSELPFFQLLIVLGLAFVVPIVVSRSKRIWIPVVIGELIAGIIVGKSGFGIVEQNAVLRILSELGFVYLMFLSGLEIDFSIISKSSGKTDTGKPRPLFRNPLFLGVGSYLATLVLSVAAAWAFQKAGWVKDIWIMALILSTTSLGIVVPILKEKKLSRTNYGQMVLFSTIIADFGSIFLVSVYILLQSRGSIFEVLLILILIAAFAAVYKLTKYLQDRVSVEGIMEELSSATSQIRMRGSFVLVLIFVVLAESLGTETILGAFLAGAIVSIFSDDSTLLKKKLDAIGYGFFIPIFFVMVGVDFDMGALFSSNTASLLVPSFLTAAFTVKLVASLPYRLVSTWRETLSAGILMSSRLSLIIAVAAIGLQIGMITEAVNTAAILTAIVSCTVAPPLFNLLAPAAPDRKDGILIVGCRYSGELLRKRLIDQGREVTLFCRDTAVQRHILESPQAVITANKLHEQLIQDMEEKGQLESISTLVTMEENDDEALRLCRMCKKKFGIPHIISWVKEPANNPRFRKLGARIVNPVYSTLLIMENLVLNPNAFSMTPDPDETMKFSEIKVKSPAVAGKTIAGLNLPATVTILSIRRMGESIMPENDTVIRPNDVITLVGPDSDMAETLLLFY